MRFRYHGMTLFLLELFSFDWQPRESPIFRNWP